MFTLIVLCLVFIFSSAHEGGDTYNYYGNDYLKIQNDQPNVNQSSGLVGRPGKMGPKGSPGIKGEQGDTGPEGSCQCQCDNTEVVKMLVQLQKEIQALKCGYEALFIDGTCFRVITERPTTTHSEAERVCQVRGASLAHVKTQANYQKVRDYLFPFRGDRVMNVWIGGTYQGDGVIQWTDGETGTADFWWPSYPSSDSGWTYMLLELNTDGRDGIWNYLPSRNSDHQYPLCQFAV